MLQRQTMLSVMTKTSEFIAGVYLPFIVLGLLSGPFGRSLHAFLITELAAQLANISGFAHTKPMGDAMPVKAIA